MSDHNRRDCGCKGDGNNAGGSKPAGSKNSRLSGFHANSLAQRLQRLTDEGWLTESQARQLAQDSTGGLSQEAAEYRSENNLGTFALPFGIALNILIDGHDQVAPMVVEEPSVVAAVSYSARMIREGGGFTTEYDGDEMIAQVQFVDVPDPAGFERLLVERRPQIDQLAAQLLPRLYARGGGLRDVICRALPGVPPMHIVHLVVDVCDAMGANLVNSLAEELTPLLARLAGREPVLRILSNLADRRLVRARCKLPWSMLAGHNEDANTLGQRIEWASLFAERDPYRAATHNKGIMNGIDAVVIASGNDWRQVEAGAHAYAARSGTYTALACWRNCPQDKCLKGEIELPLALGTVGPQIEQHARTRLFYHMTGISKASDLARLIASVGLAQNVGALRALASEGIQEGHMRLHARSVALAADCPPDRIPWLIAELVRCKDIKIETARRLLGQV